MTAATTSVTTQVYRVYIKASPQKIWEAITDPAWTERYGYGGYFEETPTAGRPFRMMTSEAMRAVGSP